MNLFLSDGLPPNVPVTVPQAASSCAHEIRAPLRDKLIVSAQSAATQWFHPALVTGALAVALGLGWIGGGVRLVSSLPLRPRRPSSKQILRVVRVSPVGGPSAPVLNQIGR